MGDLKKTTLGERIRHIRESLLKLNQGEFAKNLGFSRVATISDYEKDKRTPDIAVLRKIATIGHVTLEWLLTGEGKISIYDISEPVLRPLKDPAAVYSQDFTEVKVYDMAAVEGPGRFPGAEPVRSILVPRKDYERGSIALRVRGNGMSPTISDGAIAGIDVSNKRPVSGEIYAVWLDFEGVTIKRLFVYPDRVVLKPDNPAFPETAIFVTKNPDEEFIIGKVAWVYQSFA
ncbi:MAG: LexA family transcriptional regulator [Deltaproteobacteria bacterium]|nr:LexA family transcriptional regulator [Deltaproteobacteria bacterium]